MSYGLNCFGNNDSILFSTLAPVLFFRGKGVRKTGSGLTYYPADEPGHRLSWNDGAVFFNITVDDFGGSPGVSQVTKVSSGGSFEGGSCLGGGSSTGPTATLQRTVVYTTWSITAPTKPIVFINTLNNAIKSSVVGIVQNGGVYPNLLWDVLLVTGFPLGTSEATIVAATSIYAFSEPVVEDLSEDYGIRVFDANGDPTFSVDRKTLVIKDFVTITGSTTPANIANIIYSRTFAPNPTESVFDIAKPGFLNVDFARYSWRQYVTNNIQRPTFTVDSSFGNQCGYFHVANLFVDQEFITAGVSKNNANNDLDFSLVSVRNRWSVEYQGYLFQNGSASGGSNSILSKNENFPITIPIINCADYD